MISMMIGTCQPIFWRTQADAHVGTINALFGAKPAKSTLGVPLMVAREVIGALLMQDFNQEHRFGDKDMHFMETVAGQVAASLQSSLVIEQTGRQLQQDRLLHEVTNKIRSSNDINTILQTTVNELGKVMGASRARIELNRSLTITPDQDSSETEILTPGSL
jgi:GAF domain-containing protein